MLYRAWAYICVVLLSAIVVSGYVVLHSAPMTTSWVSLLGLTVLATVAQLRKADGPNHMAFFATPVFLFAGVFVLDPAAFIILVAVPHGVEWAHAVYTRRKHLRTWYIQPFNIAMHLLAGSAARWVSVTVPASVFPSVLPAALVSLLVAMGTYLFVTQTLLGQALVLVRGLTWRETGVWTFGQIFPDVVMLCMGGMVVIVWQRTPWLTLLALAPLMLLYQALKIPKLQHEAQTDSKTGLLNARYFTTIAIEEIERAARFGRPVAVIMADLDLLRTINNTYGHLVGDQVIAGVGQVIRRTIRQSDIAARFGGEEFAIVLPEATLLDAKVLAERLRQATAEATFALPNSPTPIRATMSVGVACCPDDGTTLKALTHAADVAVYQAKLHGRNRVVCAADVPHATTLEHGTLLPSVDTGPAAPRTTAPSEAAGLPAAPRVRQGEECEEGSTQHTTVRAPRSTGPARLAVFVSSVIMLGLAVTVLGWHMRAPLDGVTLGMLLLVAVVTELMHISVYGGNTMSVSLVALIAAALLGGLPAVTVVSAAIAVTAHVRRGHGWQNGHKLAFNWATHVIADTLPIGVMIALDRPLDSAQVLWLAPLVAGATLGYYGVETGLISVAMSLAQGRSVASTWRAQFRWLAGHYVVMGLMGMSLAISYTTAGAMGIFVFALPLALLRYVQQQYVARTTASVQELQRMNGELARANAEVGQANGAIRQLNDELFLMLAKMFDARDPYVGGHAAQVARYAVAIATELGLPDARVEQVRQAAYLHDIGKMAIPEVILNKPGKLTDEEYAYLQTHVTLGADFLQTAHGLRHLAPFVRYHHERWDGMGYPDKLHGEHIPLEARILNVCDSVEAMASDRPYHRALSVCQILDELQRCSGTQFDPTIAAIFVRLVERQGELFVVNSARVVAEATGQGNGLRPPPFPFPPPTMYTPSA